MSANSCSRCEVAQGCHFLPGMGPLWNDLPMPTPARGPPIEPFIGAHHLVYGKTLLDPAPTARAIEGPESESHLHHLVLAFHQKASFAMLDQFGHRTASVGQHRGSRCHRLDHDHPKRLVP